ncbi:MULTISPECIES: 3-hydroxyacyl-CoA dehydrogenase family protein [unclassified Yoonia]|uniref:3-hydroxyacyl-CoA dehydrogenase family protein n=1 Tax=unclassified Yoonia TaxID=2629118 RepID=UPI002B003992|nr:MULTISPECIES: 3-hydroxyacyl-CoA dehydrogenase family protein [unclassified Yoonia]
MSTGTDYHALADHPLVIEAVFEDMAVKQAVFAQLDAVMPADAVLASNTSYLDVNALAAMTRDPSRILGLHFFAPAHVMKLLEVVRADQTGPRALATGAALAKLLGKVAVVAGVCDGFIGNRIMSAYRRDCEFMLEEGAAASADRCRDGAVWFCYGDLCRAGHERPRHRLGAAQGPCCGPACR